MRVVCFHFKFHTKHLSSTFKTLVHLCVIGTVLYYVMLKSLNRIMEKFRNKLRGINIKLLSIPIRII